MFRKTGTQRRVIQRSGLIRTLAFVTSWMGCWAANSAAGKDATPAIAPDLDGPVRALALYGDYVVAGGSFTQADAVPAPYLALWSGRWSAIQPELDGPVSALAVLQGDLVVGGEFTHAGSLEVNHIARWDGSTWHALGSGTDGPVRALLVQQDVFLFAGGDFFHAGGKPARSVARWVVQWDSLGAGVDGEVNALANLNGKLIAGGRFRLANASEIDSSLVAVLNVQTWARLAPRYDGTVFTMTVYNDELVVGGDFHQISFEEPAGGLARLVGMTWLPMGAGFMEESFAPATVRGVTVQGGDLVVGGSFDRIYSLSAHRVARWNYTTEWVPLASGTNGDVQALVDAGEGLLFAAGEFTRAGDMAVNNIAAYRETGWASLRTVPVQIEDLTATRDAAGVRLRWKMSAAARTMWRSIEVERAEQDEGPYERRTTIPLEPAAEMDFEDHDVEAGREYWYRLALVSSGGSTEFSHPVGVRASGALEFSALHAPRLSPNGQIAISYRVGAAAPVHLEVFDVRGRHVRTLAWGIHPAGEYVRNWDRRTSAGRFAARGIYVVRLQSGTFLAARKLPLLVR